MRFLKIGLFWIIYGCAYAAIEMQVSPQQPMLDDEIQLILKQTDSNDKRPPDLSGLSNDFEIIGTQQSMSYQFFNGHASQENMWTVVMHARRAGQITIPPIQWGTEKTKAMSLEVQTIASNRPLPAPATSQRNVFMQWTFEPEQPVLHEQIKVHLEIIHHLPLLDAKLSPPTVENGLLFSLDQHQHRIDMIQGKRFEIEKYEYMIYPQKAGEMVVHGPELNAMEYEMIPTPIHETLKAQTFKVGLPESMSNIENWLPAKSLSFKELKPLQQDMGIQAGDTIGRKIRIDAIGVPGNLLPDLKPSCGENCKVYVKPAKIKNQVKQGELYGSKTFEINYLPTREGDFQIQAIDIPWFNTKTRKREHLDIPAFQLKVFKDGEMPTMDKVQAPQLSSQKQIPLWGSMLMALMGGMLLMKLWTSMRWKKYWQQFQEQDFGFMQLKKACLAQDMYKTRELILNWAQQAGFEKPIRDLYDISAQVDNEAFKKELGHLNECLYAAKKTKKWDGEAFWHVFSALKLKKLKKNNVSMPSPHLNP
ncbi:MAG: hypothetical protein EBQ95_07730 [Gammaproteobacteria bacterium]|nr:hypothetical protein [Gammaproteobacteria bacterium]